MKKSIFLTSLVFAFIAEITMLVIFTVQKTENWQDAVVVNEIVQSVKKNWDKIRDYKDSTGKDYTVVNNNGTVLYSTGEGISRSINEAIIHRDTILDIEKDGGIAGKVIIYNNSAQEIKLWKRKVFTIMPAAVFIQFIVCLACIIYLKYTIIRPFYKMKSFAERIAGGNLDIPLEMDRQNIFGAFTESFDIMRSELKRAHMAEAKANASKKELVAKLSHDIKTPVASIKAVAELGMALTGSGQDLKNYQQIIYKADQINTLVTNLFTATLEELEQLSITPVCIDSREVKEMLINSDYMELASAFYIPDCLLYADRLRLQQVFDNIFANSYKYAKTKIDINAYTSKNSLEVSIEDYGGGVNTEELPFLMEKFRRGKNTAGIEGAGLGLYISSYFMNGMKGGLKAGNGENGLKVIVSIALNNSI